MFYRYSLPLAGVIILLLIGCGAKTYTAKSSGPVFSGIRLQDTQLNSEIKIVDEGSGKQASEEDAKSSFFILNPQVQGWKTYYYIENIFDQFPDVAPDTEKEIPVVLNDKVIHYMVYFQNEGRKSFSIWLERSGKYMPLMKKILTQRGLPTDLVYLSMIESGFNVKAKSRSAAVGPWQFIKPTALRYGLRVDDWVDERMDPRRSTIAAANYLSDLYAMFQSWELAAAGYNCGEDRVQAAIDQYQINDFWQISEFTLPEETKNYVPKLMAALIIAKNPEKYGFVGLDYYEPEFYDTAMVPPQKSLYDIAKVIGVSYSNLTELNPEILHNATPPGGPYQINVPQGYASITSQKSRELYALKNVNPMIARVSAGGTHRVGRGETLSKIAARYGVSVASIKRANELRNSTIRTGQTLRIPGLSRPINYYASAGNISTTVKYIVRRGDTLGAIAARNRVSIASIKKANGLNGHFIRAGEVLIIPGASGRYYDTQVETGNTTKIAIYTVKPGDTLGEIAAKYNVSVTTIMRANRLPGFTIQAGQRLDIPYIASNGTYIAGSDATYADTLTTAAQSQSATRTTSNYTVKSGDTLGEIAEKHGVTVASIKNANDMSGSMIRHGDVITIPSSSSVRYKDPDDTPVKNSASTKYRVKKGDTLASISKSYGVSVGSIQSANNLNGSTIRYGQVLTIPGSPGVAYASSGHRSRKKYKVRPGDTLSSVAQKNGVGISSLKSANNIRGSEIRSGEVLVIPGGGSSGNDSDVISYCVKKGDTLWDIANKHNVSVASIQKWNNLKSAELTPGTSLTIYK
jgi:membrane-bound lytic murein transglycosylase D